MPCDSQTLVDLAAVGKFAGLSDRDLKIATLYALCVLPGPGATAQTLVDGGYAQGYDSLSDRDLDEAILAVICANVNTQIIESGLATLSGGTVTVNSANASATNPILLTYYGPGQSSLSYDNIVSGVSFDINSGNGADNGIVSWAILKP